MKLKATNHKIATSVVHDKIIKKDFRSMKPDAIVTITCLASCLIFCS